MQVVVDRCIFQVAKFRNLTAMKLDYPHPLLTYDTATFQKAETTQKGLS